MYVRQQIKTETDTRMLLFNWSRTTHECVYLLMPVYPVFCSCNLDLDLMTLVYEIHLDIIKACSHTENEVSESRLSKARAWKGQTDRQDQTYYYAAFARGNKMQCGFVTLVIRAVCQNFVSRPNAGVILARVLCLWCDCTF